MIVSAMLTATSYAPPVAASDSMCAPSTVPDPAIDPLQTSGARMPVHATRDPGTGDATPIEASPSGASSFRALLASQKISDRPKAAQLPEAAPIPASPIPPPVALPLSLPPELEAVLAAIVNGGAATAATAPAPAPAPAPAGTPPAATPAMTPANGSSVQPSNDPTSSFQQLAIGPPPDAVKATPALTPLEQAVHDLISQITHRGRERDVSATTSDARTTHLTALPVAAPQVAQPQLAPTRSAPVLAPTAPSEPRALPEQAAPSHLHLVLGDDADRVVVTVAVRGADINVTLRASDDQTAAALSRNAAALDHAMRGRGLNLSELTAERDLDRQRNPDRPAREREEATDSEPFDLEEAS